MEKSNSTYRYDHGGGDEQYTPPETVKILLPHIQHVKDKTIWCPFDREDSQFVQVLRANGFKVVYSHIDYGQDFFEYEPEHWDLIISNPPYKGKRAFWERCLSLGKPFALLLPVHVLNDLMINETMRERERVGATFARQADKVLQRQNWAEGEATDIQSYIYWRTSIQTANYIGNTRKWKR